MDRDATLIQKSPKISVGMPVYNGELYLRDAITSVLCQTMRDFEFIISDNASNDGTEEICRDFAKQDDRIRYTRNSENLGAARNYNRVFELACGRYFRWANADDLFKPELHEKCAAVLDGNPRAVLTYGKTEIIDESGSVLHPYEDNLNLQQELARERFLAFFRQVGLTNVIYGLMRADAMRKTNLFGDGTMPAVDTRFMAELTLQGTFVEIPEVLFYRRMHPSASSFDRKDSDRQQQFWKANSRGFKLPVSRLYFGYLKSVWQAPISVLERCRLSLHVTKWIIARSPSIVSEIYDYIRGKFGKDQS
jgi:glycosyltransferase involved in cell wall biosynthesis